MTQRGCPYSCTFCEASSILGKRRRIFTPERVIEELKILKNEKGAKGIYFQDSTFTINKRYSLKLFDLMIKEKLNLKWTCNTRTDHVDDEICDAMYKSGCRQIAFGIESGNQESLDVIKKHVTVERQEKGIQTAHKYKISTMCSYILCLPNENEEMVLNTINFARRMASRIAIFYLPVPFPGSALYQSCAKTGGIRKTDSWSDFLAIDFKNPVYINPLIGKKRMQELYKLAFRRFYASPRVWYSNFRSLFWGMPLSSALMGVRAVSSILGRNPLTIVKKLYRGYHGQNAVTEL